MSTHRCTVKRNRVVCPKSTFKIRRFTRDKDENPAYERVVKDALKKAERILKPHKGVNYPASEIWEGAMDISMHGDSIPNTVGATVNRINKWVTWQIKHGNE